MARDLGERGAAREGRGGAALNTCTCVQRGQLVQLAASRCVGRTHPSCSSRVFLPSERIVGRAASILSPSVQYGTPSRSPGSSQAQRKRCTTLPPSPAFPRPPPRPPASAHPPYSARPPRHPSHRSWMPIRRRPSWIKTFRNPEKIACGIKAGDDRSSVVVRGDDPALNRNCSSLWIRMAIKMTASDGRPRSRSSAGAIPPPRPYPSRCSSRRTPGLQPRPNTRPLSNLLPPSNPWTCLRKMLEREVERSGKSPNCFTKKLYKYGMVRCAFSHNKSRRYAEVRVQCSTRIKEGKSHIVTPKRSRTARSTHVLAIPESFFAECRTFRR